MVDRELVVEREEVDLIIAVASLMALGYVVDGERYVTEDGYICQPMSKKKEPRKENR